MTQLVWLWNVIPLWLGILLAPFAFLAGGIIRGSLGL